MKNKIDFIEFKHEQNERKIPFCGVEAAKTVRTFHKSFPGYLPTPLVSLRDLADSFQLKGLYVKDESSRFGLNAFKALGGSYAIGCILADMIGENIDKLPYARLVSDEVRNKTGDITFITATDGNHGRGVAWTAEKLKHKCIVYLPKGTASERLENIRKLGAEAEITELVYDDAVRLARKQSEDKGYVLVQDTSMEGYEKIPKLIMQGYTTMASEAVEQLGNVKPTHIFLQAGVGSMAAAVAEFLSDYYGDDKPIISIIEPNGADCLFKTAQANDGRLHIVSEPHSIMAGLCCGEPCSVAWEMLKQYADFFFSVPEETAAIGMRILACPLGNDKRIISGESGASTFGFVSQIMRKPEFKEIKNKLKLDEDSVVLCFSTEGDTDRENYRRIVWDGFNGE